MSDKILFLPIIIPLLGAVLALLAPKGLRRVIETFAFGTVTLNLLLAVVLFKNNLSFSLPWLNYNFSFILRLYNFSAFIILAISVFAFLIVLYSLAFLKGKEIFKQFYFYLLLSLAFVNGSVLADSLLVLLFFWEGILVTLFGMIAIGNKFAFKTATKAFIIVGVSDLCMMFGIVLTGHLAGTFTMSKISLPLNGLGSLAFILLVIGAIAKGGSMPFHTWIPDASLDAPLPFMAFFPASLEKLLGIYLLARISLDLFQLTPASGMSMVLMITGAVTLLFAVMMALIQKDFKKLLSYHAISQVGYMILGIGTALPVGIIGGLFHMLNNALYKSCLFLTGGAVEKQAGSTNLEKLGGLRSKMPVTFACFVICALAISGVPPFNGFFSKELVYDAALLRGKIFYIIAILGSFFTAASFLKLGHAAFLGKRNPEHDRVKEAPVTMLIPMIAIAFICIIFGIYNTLPIRGLLEPILGAVRLEGESFAGFPKNTLLVVVTVLVLIAALLNHLFAVRKFGRGIKAADHFHYAPGLAKIYVLAEQRFFDPYNVSLKITSVIAQIGWWIDRSIDWIYEKFITRLTFTFTFGLRRLHSGNYSVYLVWAILGVALIMGFLMGAH